MKYKIASVLFFVFPLTTVASDLIGRNISSSDLRKVHIEKRIELAKSARQKQSFINPTLEVDKDIEVLSFDNNIKVGTINHTVGDLLEDSTKRVQFTVPGGKGKVIITLNSNAGNADLYLTTLDGEKPDPNKAKWRSENELSQELITVFSSSEKETTYYATVFTAENEHAENVILSIQYELIEMFPETPIFTITKLADDICRVERTFTKSEYDSMELAYYVFTDFMSSTRETNEQLSPMLYVELNGQVKKIIMGEVKSCSERLNRPDIMFIDTLYIIDHPDLGFNESYYNSDEGTLQLKYVGF